MNGNKNYIIKNLIQIDVNKSYTHKCNVLKITINNNKH